MLLQDYYIDSKSILQKHLQKVNHLHKQKFNGSQDYYISLKFFKNIFKKVSMTRSFHQLEVCLEEQVEIVELK